MLKGNIKKSDLNSEYMHIILKCMENESWKNWPFKLENTYACTKDAHFKLINIFHCPWVSVIIW